MITLKLTKARRTIGIAASNRYRIRATSLLKALALGAILLVGLSAGPRIAVAGMWNDLAHSIEAGKKHRALCAEHPTDSRCKPIAASTLLVQCESGLPENLGRCHGTLSAYAHDGAASLLEWRCVPPAVVDDSEQLRRLFIRQGGRMPEVLQQPAHLLLYYAVAKAFPCPLQPGQMRR